MPSHRRPALRLLGGAALLGRHGQPLSGPAAHRHPLALAAVLALARPGGVQREKLVGLLWPERDATAARGLLRVALHTLRQALGAESIRAVGDALRLEPAAVAVDVHAFEDALAAGDPAAAVARYHGAFLDGFFVDDAHALDEWIGAQRMRLARLHEDALETLATSAERTGERVAAATWWRTLASARLGDGRVALRTMEALAAAGDRAGALSVADAHAALLRSEYGVVPDGALLAYADALRARGGVAVDGDGETEAVGGSGSGVRTCGNTPVGNDAVATAPTPPTTVTPPAGVTTAAFPAPTLPPHGAPEGSGMREPVSPSTQPRPRRHISLALAVITAFAMAGALRGRPRPLNTPDVLAVAPFDVIAPAPLGLGDGLATLLALDLDQVADVRIVSPRVSAARAASVADRTRLARALGSDAAVTGVVAPAPGGVVVRAALVDTAGVALARVEARGAADDLTALVDQLSLGVLRTVWGRRWRVPAPRLAAVSTTSPDALRAYLRGEAHFRTARWDSAAAAFTAATERDSAFALAYLRLAETEGWRGGMGQPPTMRALAAAGRWASRLPPRERGLLAVWTRHEAGDLAALDSARALAERYPDDPDARYALADTYFHALPSLGARDAARTAAAFDTAAAIDPTSARVREHPLELALELDDRARFDRAVAALLDSVAPPTESPDRASEDAAARERYAALRAVRWSAPDDAARAFVRSLQRSRAGVPLAAPRDLDLRVRALVRAAFDAPVPRPDVALAALVAARAMDAPESEPRARLEQSATSLLIALGRLTDARPRLDAFWRYHGLDASSTTLLPAALGYAPPAWVAANRAQLAQLAPSAGDPLGRRVAAYWRGLYALAAGDTAEGRRELRRSVARATPGDDVPAALVGLARAGQGWALLLAGDSAAALRELDAGLHDAGYGSLAKQLGRVPLAVSVRLAAARPDTRDAAIDRLRWLTRGWYAAQWAWWHRELAPALAAQGRRDEADAERQRFAALWAGADPLPR